MHLLADSRYSKPCKKTYAQHNKKVEPKSVSCQSLQETGEDAWETRDEQAKQLRPLSQYFPKQRLPGQSTTGEPTGRPSKA